MKVATYNIHYGVGGDGRLDLARAIELVRDADIVALQEVDRHWNRSDNVDQADAISVLMPDHEPVFGPTVDVAKASLDGGWVRGLRRQIGNMLLSRYPILSVRNHLLPKYGLASDGLELQKGVIEVVVESPLGLLRIYATHLCHLCEEQRVIQAKHLLDLHHRAPLEGPALKGRHPSDPSFSSEPTLLTMPDAAILLGDFNSEPDGPAYTTLVGVKHPRWGRLAKTKGFVDAWCAAGHSETVEEGGGATASRNRRVDYCLVSEMLSDRIAAAEVRDDNMASDHFPVVVTLQE